MKKLKVINVRLDENMYTFIEECAKKYDVSMAAYVRTLVAHEFELLCKRIVRSVGEKK